MTAADVLDLTARALFLNQVINRMFEIVVADRARGLGLTVEAPSGTGVEIVAALRESGLLGEDEYQPSV